MKRYLLLSSVVTILLLMFSACATQPGGDSNWNFIVDLSDYGECEEITVKTEEPVGVFFYNYSEDSYAFAQGTTIDMSQLDFASVEESFSIETDIFVLMGQDGAVMLWYEKRDVAATITQGGQIIYNGILQDASKLGAIAVDQEVLERLLEELEKMFDYDIPVYEA